MEHVSRRRKGRIRDELVIGMAAVVVLCAAVTYGAVLSSTQRGFKELVERNDIEIAEHYAEALAEAYSASGSLAGVEAIVKAVRAVSSDPKTKARDSVPSLDGSKHPRGDDSPPILVTDERGLVVYSGAKPRDTGDAREPPAKLPISLGAPIKVSEATVGYVFWKSMIQPSYSIQEAAYLSSLAKSLALSVGAGLGLAIAMGAALASRFARRVTSLGTAVGALASGDLSARADERDGDELGTLAAGFNRMGERLEAAEAARQSLLADLAHELRTPLSIIQANLEMMIDGVYRADAERLRGVYDETLLLSDLVGNLRTISDIETGAAPSDPRPIELRGALKDACDQYRPLFERKGIALTLEGGTVSDGVRLSEDGQRDGGDGAGQETVSPIVTADLDRLNQAIRNILSNTLKYAPPGSKVEARWGFAAVSGAGGTSWRSGRVGRIAIADEGPGVPEADLERIFDRFYRVDGSRNRDSGGRGLGLAIARRAIESFGGEIAARNRAPSGLEMTIDLPLAP